MRAVGVKVLKNQLSKYLDLIRGGETILVTDRDEVIAEIHRPTQRQVPGLDPWEAAMNRWEREGTARACRRSRSAVAERLRSEPIGEIRVDALALLLDSRKERF